MIKTVIKLFNAGCRRISSRGFFRISFTDWLEKNKHFSCILAVKGCSNISHTLHNVTVNHGDQVYLLFDRSKIHPLSCGCLSCSSLVWAERGVQFALEAYHNCIMHHFKKAQLKKRICAKHTEKSFTVCRVLIATTKVSFFFVNSQPFYLNNSQSGRQIWHVCVCIIMIRTR